MNKRLIKSNDEGGGVSFNTVLYNGNGTASQSITGLGFQPDLVWIKARNKTWWNHISDSIRGNNNTLFSNSTVAENLNVYIPSVSDPDGFTVSRTGGEGTNNNGDNYVAWCWKAGGAAVSNTDGTITSQVSANVDAGFSIVSFTSSPTANQVYSLGHGLGNTPKVIITKERDGTLDWITYHESLGFGSFVALNSTNASNSVSQVWGTTPPNSSVFEMKSSITINPGKQAIAYCFAEVAGFSKFGSYTGNGTTSNNIVTGFEPAFIMIKRADSTGNWFMLDNKRDNTNPNNLFLLANASDNEKDLQVTDNLNFVNFLENGFEVLNGGNFCNANGGEYIYMAFANQF